MRILQQIFLKICLIYSTKCSDSTSNQSTCKFGGVYFRVFHCGEILAFRHLLKEMLLKWFLIVFVWNYVFQKEGGTEKVDLQMEIIIYYLSLMFST